MQSQCFVEVASFNDFARYQCALREHPLSSYSQVLKGKPILSSGVVFSNTILWLYIPHEGKSRYISYKVKGGKEYCKEANTTKEIASYSPIVHFELSASPLKIKKKKISDQFHPIKIKDVDSLARLTYNPELPDEPNTTLFLIPNKKKWALGYISSVEMETVMYLFSYVELDKNPEKPFVKYSGGEERQPQFSNSFEHGYPYLPIIQLKENHSIFGLLEN